MQTVAETRHFLSRAEKLLSSQERTRLIMTLAFNPLLGVLIEGAGGIRKYRFAREGRGKSGGLRVVHFYFDAGNPIIMLDIYGKNERANLSEAEKRELAALVRELKKEWRRNL